MNPCYSPPFWIFLADGRNPTKSPPDFKGLFPNTAFDTSIQNASEPQMRNMKNSRAILNVSNQGAATFWTRWGKVGIEGTVPSKERTMNG
jgi:hypothetical protein